jgi:hypothetical protein
MERKEKTQEDIALTPYKPVSDLPLTHKLFKEVAKHQLTPFLDHIEYLASLGLQPKTIADRIGLDWEILRDFADKFPDVKAALKGGRARGVEEAAATIQRNARMGDTAAAVAVLKGSREWASNAPISQPVTVNIGAQPAPIQADRAARMIEEQKLIDLEPDD